MDNDKLLVVLFHTERANAAKKELAFLRRCRALVQNNYKRSSDCFGPEELFDTMDVRSELDKRIAAARQALSDAVEDLEYAGVAHATLVSSYPEVTDNA